MMTEDQQEQMWMDVIVRSLLDWFDTMDVPPAEVAAFPLTGILGTVQDLLDGNADDLDEVGRAITLSLHDLMQDRTPDGWRGFEALAMDLLWSLAQEGDDPHVWNATQAGVTLHDFMRDVVLGSPGGADETDLELVVRVMETAP